MIFHNYSNLDGKHARFSPSQPYWLGDTEEGIIKRFRGQYAAQIGTIIHDFARKYIKHGLKLVKSDKKNMVLELLESDVPGSVIDGLDIDFIFENLQSYVNDSVNFRMSPEVHLYFSDNFFGTTDAISFDEKSKKLRISDLKTGASPSPIEQLIIYTALFCLEYKVNPFDISTELKMYKNNEILLLEPDPDDISEAMEKIKTFETIIQRERGF